MDKDDLTTDEALSVLHAYCGHAHSVEARAAKKLLDAYQALLVLWAEQTAQRAKAERERDELRKILQALLASYENYASEHKPETEWDEYDMTIFPVWALARAIARAASEVG